MTKRKLKVEIIEELKIEVEEFRTKILNVVNDLFLELTDEGYDSEFKLEFERYDYKHINYFHRLSKEEIENINVLDVFTLGLKDGELYELIRGHEYQPLDDYIRISNEYLLNIKGVGEYFEYDVFFSMDLSFRFQKIK
jgi:hypothetical protein